MALPDDVTTFELTFGPYTDAAGEPVFAGMTGKIKPSFPQIRHVASGAVVIDSPIPVEIDGFGVASVELAHTDQAILSPVGFTYSVVWDVASRKPSPGNKQFAVPTSAGATVDFDLLAPSPDVEGVVVPLTYGKSAYDLAVQNGYVGTEAAWLASLVDPEGLADPVVSTLVADTASATSVELRAASDARYPRVVDGKHHALVAGVIRNPGAGWAPIVNGTHQGDANIDSVLTGSGVVTVNHANIGATKVIGFTAVPDEVLASRGVRVGLSTAPDKTTIYFYQDESLTSYVSYSGSAWASTSGKLTPTFDSTTGVLTLTRTTAWQGFSADATAYYDVTLSGRGNVLRPVITATSNAITATTVNIQFIKTDGTVQLTPTTDMKLYVSTNQHGPADPALITDTSAPSSNVWLFGIFETP